MNLARRIVLLAAMALGLIVGALALGTGTASAHKRARGAGS